MFLSIKIPKTNRVNIYIEKKKNVQPHALRSDTRTSPGAGVTSGGARGDRCRDAGVPNWERAGERPGFHGDAGKSSGFGKEEKKLLLLLHTLFLLVLYKLSMVLGLIV